jgi:hypothetical protein
MLADAVTIIGTMVSLWFKSSSFVYSLELFVGSGVRVCREVRCRDTDADGLFSEVDR